jgi:hypothetical protein
MFDDCMSNEEALMCLVDHSLSCLKYTNLTRLFSNLTVLHPVLGSLLPHLPRHFSRFRHLLVNSPTHMDDRSSHLAIMAQGQERWERERRFREREPAGGTSPYLRYVQNSNRIIHIYMDNSLQ